MLSNSILGILVHLLLLMHNVQEIYKAMSLCDIKSQSGAETLVEYELRIIQWFSVHV